MQKPAEQGQIRTAVREYLVSEFLPGEDAEGLTDTTPLISGGVLDSIAVVKLVTYFEERFEIQFESVDITYESFDTVAKMVEAIERKVG